MAIRFLGKIMGLALFASGLSGCSLNLVSNIDDELDELDEKLDDALDDLEDLEICDGMTFEDLQNSVTLSDECKDELLSFLPEPEDNFENRLIVLGSQDNNDGSLSVFLHGVNEEGIALNDDDWAKLEVSITTDGDTQVLSEGDFSIVGSADLSSDLLSIGFVNDYSGSMSTSDLQVTAEIEQDILDVLPPIFEGEVTLFSTEVHLKQEFSEDSDELLSAVAYDSEFERDLTALYDGMGTQLSSLVERERPLRLLVVATDGAENSSSTYQKAELQRTIADERVCVLILGSLFSDPDELEDLSAGCGAYFYTPAYPDLKDSVAEYVASLGAMVELQVPEELRGEGNIQVTLEGLSIEID